MRAVLAAELLKLRTTRTVWLLLAGSLGLTVLAVAGAIVVAGDGALDLTSERGVRTVLHVSASGALFVLVLGVIISAGEYRQRTVTDTFLTTPQRWRVIVAKVTIAALVGTLFGALSAGVAIAVANHLYAAKGLAFPLGSADAWSVIFGSVFYAAVFGAIGAATGSLLRNQVAAIVGWLAWLFVVESIVLGIAPSIGRWLPAAAGRALVRDPDGDLLPQSTAALVMVIYVVAVVAMAIVTDRHRDA